MSKSFTHIFTQHPLLPVVELKNAAHAVPLKEALMKAGINILEITLRTEEALAAADSIAGDENFLVGLGTLLEADQFRYASQLGADFVTSPGFNVDLISVASTEKIAYLPGVFTPSEVMLARDLEYETMKFFPAYCNKVIQHYPQLSAAFPNLNFCLTGGLNQDNLLATMDMRGVIACGGSWLAPKELIAAEDWDGVTETAQRAVRALSNHRREHEAAPQTAQVSVP